MSTEGKTKISVGTIINVPLPLVWHYWTMPEHIIKWNHASDDWQTSRAQNDLQVGGKFSSRMEAKDGSVGFDFEGMYDIVILHQIIEYTLTDGRKVKIVFDERDDKTSLVETFDAENQNPIELQRFGWQSIIDNFKKYAESISG